MSEPMSQPPSRRRGSAGRKITILHLLDHLAMGGVQQCLVTQLRHYAKQRFRALVVTLKKEQTWPLWPDIPEIASSRLALIRHERDNAGIAALAELLRRERVDVLHCHSYFPNTVGRQAALLAGTPVTIAHYYSTYGHRRGSSMAAWERVLLPLTSRALMVSRCVEQAWSALAGLPAPRGTVVQVPLDLEKTRSAAALPSPSVEQALAECSPGWPMICSVGRLVRLKRMADIIEATAILKSRNRPVRLMIAGEGPERPALEEQIRRRGLSDRVRLLGNIDEVGPLLARAAASALASDVEGFGLGYLEAMACGAPVITTPIAGATEVDPKGEFLRVVPHRDPSALAEAVCDLLDNPDKTARRIERAARAVERFDCRAWVKRLEAIYTRELRHAWLAKHRPWGYGGRLAKGRLLAERLRWRLLRWKGLAHKDAWRAMSEED